MAVQNDQTVPEDAILYRVLINDPRWQTTKGGRNRPSSLAFYESTGEVSFFVHCEGMLEELHRLFPGMDIAAVRASEVRGNGVGLGIERRPTEVPGDFGLDPSTHVVVGPMVDGMSRLDFQDRARELAKKDSTLIIPALLPQPQQHPEEPQPEPPQAEEPQPPPEQN